MTGEELTELANMNNWNVELEPVYYGGKKTGYYIASRVNPFGENVEVTKANGTKEMRDPNPLGIHKGRYRVFQNEEVRDFAEGIVGEGGKWDCAGAIKDGKQIFYTIEITDNDFLLDPNGSADEVKTYVVVRSSHDGSLAVEAITTPIRVVCQNTVTWAFKGATDRFKVRHTESMEGRIQQAQQTLKIADRYMAAFQKEAREMLEIELTKKQFDELVTGIYPQPKPDVTSEGKVANKKAIGIWERKRDNITSIYLGKDENKSNENLGSNLWNAANAIIEEAQWYNFPVSEETIWSPETAENKLVRASGFSDASINSSHEIQRKVKQFANSL